MTYLNEVDAWLEIAVKIEAVGLCGGGLCFEVDGLYYAAVIDLDTYYRMSARIGSHLGELPYDFKEDGTEIVADEYEAVWGFKPWEPEPRILAAYFLAYESSER